MLILLNFEKNNVDKVENEIAWDSNFKYVVFSGFLITLGSHYLMRFEPN